ncbi:MAG: c-type cytochrome domain-containing protein, partial [Anaerolineae bacterium]
AFARAAALLAVAGGAAGIGGGAAALREGAAHSAPAFQAGTCSITGRVSLVDGDDASGIRVRANEAAEATTGADGRFRLDGLAPGAVRLRAVRARHLSALAEAVPCVAGAVTTMAAAQLPGGDADGNDRVDLFDLVRITAAYRRCAAETDFDPTADLDDSGCVDLFDLVRVTSAYGTNGPVEWRFDAAPDPTPSPTPVGTAPAAVSFREDVLPIFARECRTCHGHVAGLNLDDHAAVMAGGNGGPVIVPGDPQASRLYLKVSRQVAPYMPPGGVRLSDEDIAAIRRWIESGVPDN